MSHRQTCSLNRAEALQLWHRVNLGAVRADRPDLSTRQMALLTCVYLEPGPHTVRSLAARLNVTKAVISRALNTLGQYQFVSRLPDLRDKRSVLIGRTAQGARYLSDFAEQIRFEAKTLKTPVAGGVFERVSAETAHLELAESQVA